MVHTTESDNAIRLLTECTHVKRILQKVKEIQRVYGTFMTSCLSAVVLWCRISVPWNADVRIFFCWFFWNHNSQCFRSSVVTSSQIWRHLNSLLKKRRRWPFGSLLYQPLDRCDGDEPTRTWLLICWCHVQLLTLLYRRHLSMTSPSVAASAMSSH